MSRVPVYGFPILNKPDMMKRMLDTFDYDVQRLYIVDNGGVVKPDDVKHFRANNIHIADPGYNMGVASSWNFIIRANTDAEWWLIGCVDMDIQPGVIAKVVEDMELHAGTPHMVRVVMGNEASWGNHFGLFALNPECIDSLGWFDDNIYPIYFEDNDYMERMKRARDNGTFTDTLLSSDTVHSGNASWTGEAELAVGNKRSWGINGPYYESKWHDGERHRELPFDIAGEAASIDGIRYIPSPLISTIRQQDWHVARKDNVKNDGHFS